MLNYLKEQLADIQQQQHQETVDRTQPTDAQILEYASLFQELDDLSIDGARATTAVREPVSIPLENDFEVELNTVQMNVSDGRITDIPADATVTEAFELLSSKYTVMKTRNDFVQEAYSVVTRMPRESDARYQARVDAYISEQWAAYNQYIVQEGLFGHDKVDLNDTIVPDKVTIDFGAGKNGHNYMVTVPVKWETDKKQRVTRKQIDSVGIFQRMPSDIWSEVTDNVMKSVRDKYNVSEGKDKWDVITPTSVIVPIDPADHYAIIIEFDTDCSKDPIYWRLMLPVKANASRSIESAKDLFDGGAPQASELFSQANKMDVMRKRDFKLEYAEMQRPSRFGNRPQRFYTEGIDFGGGAATPDAAPPPEMAGAAADAGPTVNVGDAPAPDAAAAAPEAQQVTAPAAVNDVSDEIAQNVAAQTQAEENGADGDIDIDINDVDATVNEDLPDADESDISGTDSQLDSLDDVGAEDLPSDDPSLDDISTDDTGVPDMSNVDMDNMTVDQLIEQGAEKLKGMTLNQLKEFLNSPDGTSPEDISTESYMMLESFFTREDNVKKRIQTSLKDAVKGFKKIVKGIEEDEWDRDTFRGFWFQKQTGTSWNSGNTSEGDWYGGTSASYAGAYFSRTVGDLYHYLKIGVKKRRARNAFTEDEHNKLEKFLNNLKKYIKMCDTCATGIKSNDVDLDEVVEGTKSILEEAEGISDIVVSKKFMESVYFEAAVITKKNVKSQIQEHIKSALGILNNTEFNFRELVEAFRKEGKALNKILTKATKMKKIFTQSQINEIDRLNSILVDLQSNMRLNALNEDYTKKVKGLIISFAQQCKRVNASLEGKAVQEYAYDETIQEAANTTKRRMKESMLGGLIGSGIALASFGVFGVPFTVLEALTVFGITSGVMLASNTIFSSSREAKLISTEVLQLISEISKALTSNDSSKSAVKELKKNVVNLRKECSYLMGQGGQDVPKFSIVVNLAEAADSFEHALSRHDYDKIDPEIIKEFTDAMKEVAEAMTGKKIDTKSIQEFCGQDTDPANCSSSNPQSVNEEDEMSYSGNNSPDDAAGGNSDNPAADGADVGGVDFESEGVQREARKVVAQIGPDAKSTLGVSKKQLRKAFTADHAGEDVDTVDPRLGSDEMDAIFEKHDKATDRYAHVFNDSLARGKARLNDRLETAEGKNPSSGRVVPSHAITRSGEDATAPRKVHDETGELMLRKKLREAEKANPSTGVGDRFI